MLSCLKRDCCSKLPHFTPLHLVNIYGTRTYVLCSLIYKIEVSVTRSLSNQLRGSYKNCYIISALKHDKTRYIQI